MKKFKEYILEEYEKWLGTTDHTKGTISASNQFGAEILHSKPQITPDEHKALGEYTGEKYREINNKLRGNGESILSSKDHKFYTKNIDSAISKHRTEHPIHVWRSIKRAIDTRNFTGNPGDILHDKGYVSTSANPAIARFYDNNDEYFHIKVPKGSKALYVPKHKIGIPSEAEVLLPRNSKFKYEGYEEVSNPGQFSRTIHHLTHIPEES